jgi:hypothetical protein
MSMLRGGNQLQTQQYEALDAPAATCASLLLPVPGLSWQPTDHSPAAAAHSSAASQLVIPPMPRGRFHMCAAACMHMKQLFQNELHRYRLLKDSHLSCDIKMS